MKMTKCYTNIFTEPLEKLGFKKYGVLYCRTIGDILQGITLRTTNPSEVCFAFYPMRNHRFMCQNCRNPDIKKGAWAEKSFISSFYYYRESEPEKNERVINGWLDTVMNDIIPIFDYADCFEKYIDKVVDLKSLDAERKMAEPDDCVQNISNMDGKMLFRQSIHENDLLWMAHIDGSFERSDNVFGAEKNAIRAYALKKNRKKLANIMIKTSETSKERLGDSDDPFGVEKCIFQESLKSAFQTEDEVQNAADEETEKAITYRYRNYLKAKAEGSTDMINSVFTEDDLKFCTLKDGIALYGRLS